MGLTARALRTELDATFSSAATRTAQVLADRASSRTPTLRDRCYAHVIVGAVQAAAQAWLEAPDGPSFTSLLHEAFTLLRADTEGKKP